MYVKDLIFSQASVTYRSSPTGLEWYAFDLITTCNTISYTISYRVHIQCHIECLQKSGVQKIDLISLLNKFS